MRKLPALSGLKYFKAAAEHLSFKLASEQLFVTQAAVSQHIKSLEEQLGCQLFTRKNREVSLTAQGRLLLPYVQKAFSELQKGIAQLEQDNDPNVLKITVLPSLATFWLLPRLHLFRERHPHIQVRLMPDPFVVDFDNFNLDLAIRYGVGEYENLESRYLFSDKALLVTHPKLVKPGTMPQDLPSLPLIRENYHDTDEAWEAFLTQYKMDKSLLNKAVEIRDATPALVGAVLAGQGISMIRQSLVEDYLQNGQLLKLFDFAHQCRDSYYLVAPQHHFKFEKVRAFELWVREEANALIALLQKC
jgi:LysR family transcriptional regulator, glycine cleavage system transcriptional activator